MNSEEAIAEVFWKALMALPKLQRQAVMERLLQDRELMEDFMDIAIVEQRRGEPSRPLEEYVAERQNEGSNRR